MARQVKRISDLPEAGPIQGDELLEIVQGGENVRVRADELGGDIAIDDVQGLPEALGERVLDDDPRLSDARVPTGGAGGVLSGQYPNPGFAVPMATAAQLDGKVDKVAGKGLSTNDLTDPLYDKLAGLEGTHWRGTFVSLAALEAGVTDPAAGDYADVDVVGEDVQRYIWDATDSEWVVQSGSVAPITAAQVKQLYESNPDTNAFTDSDEVKLGGIAAEATKNATDAFLLDRENHTGEQAISTVTGLQDRLDEMVVEAELVQASPSILIVDQLRASVEAASGGRMTVIYTASGQPSYMHILPAFNLEDVAPGGELGTGLHPAFIFDSVAASEIFIGAYQASTSQSAGAAVSLPGVDPRASINFDTARNLCKANGPGWDIMSNLDWAAIALWCMANGYEPRGNTNYGRSHEDRWETGRRQDGGIPGDASGTARTLTGSGPAAWAHDGTPAGIHDLVGNIWEWVSGMKLVNGRVWLAPDNGLTEEAQYIDSGFDLADANPWASHSNDGASDLVKQSLIAPATPALSPEGRLYVNAEGERMPLRGGAWALAGNAGLAALNLTYDRTATSTARGFRLRFRAQ